FRRAQPAVRQFASPRAWAFAILGLDEYLARFPGDRAAKDLRLTLGQRLLELHHHNADKNWPWFEDILTYSNARLPQALILTGCAIDHQEMLSTGLRALEW